MPGPTGPVALLGIVVLQGHQWRTLPFPADSASTILRSTGTDRKCLDESTYDGTDMCAFFSAMGADEGGSSSQLQPA